MIKYYSVSYLMMLLLFFTCIKLENIKNIIDRKLLIVISVCSTIVVTIFPYGLFFYTSFLGKEFRYLEISILIIIFTLICFMLVIFIILLEMHEFSILKMFKALLHKIPIKKISANLNMRMFMPKIEILKIKIRAYRENRKMANQDKQSIIKRLQFVKGNKNSGNYKEKMEEINSNALLNRLEGNSDGIELSETELAKSETGDSEIFDLLRVSDLDEYIEDTINSGEIDKDNVDNEVNNIDKEVIYDEENSDDQDPFDDEVSNENEVMNNNEAIDNVELTDNFEAMDNVELTDNFEEFYNNEAMDNIELTDNFEAMNNIEIMNNIESVDDNNLSDNDEVIYGETETGSDFLEQVTQNENMENITIEEQDFFAEENLEDNIENSNNDLSPNNILDIEESPIDEKMLDEELLDEKLSMDITNDDGTTFDYLASEDNLVNEDDLVYHDTINEENYEEVKSEEIKDLLIQDEIFEEEIPSMPEDLIEIDEPKIYEQTNVLNQEIFEEIDETIAGLSEVEMESEGIDENNNEPSEFGMQFEEIEEDDGEVFEFGMQFEEIEEDNDEAVEFGMQFEEIEEDDEDVMEFDEEQKKKFPGNNP